MTQINPFYAIIDEDGDIQEIFPENISIDWIYQVKEVRERANNETYKIVFINKQEARIIRVTSPLPRRPKATPAALA